MILAVSKGIVAALLGNGTISAAVSARVYLSQAAEGAALPYLVIDYVAGGSTNDTPRDGFDELWQVKAISGDMKQALTLADAARTALHHSGITLEAPWALVDIQHEDELFLIEDVDRRQYFHAGGTYRVRATQ